MNAFRIGQIKDDKVRELLLEAEHIGLNVVERTIGHRCVDAHAVLIIGLASMLVDLKRATSKKKKKP